MSELKCAACQRELSAPDEVTAERDRLRAILDAPVVMLFANGREPSRNEIHLANLLGWRQKEAGEARAELAEEKANHEANFKFMQEEVRRRMESHGKSLEELIQARNETLDIREAARAVLGVLRDRLDGTADEPLVDRLQAAVEGGVR